MLMDIVPYFRLINSSMVFFNRINRFIQKWILHLHREHVVGREIRLFFKQNGGE